MKAIVYTSNAGHTAAYAHMLEEELAIPAYHIKEAKKYLKNGDEIIYMGWLMAGSVKGYKAAASRYQIKALCAVGMAPDASQFEDIKKENHIGEDMPLFYLQGGFEIEKLHGVYKMMMMTMKNTVGRKLEDKPDRSPEEEDMLKLMIHGGNLVNRENLSEILSWYKTA